MTTSEICLTFGKSWRKSQFYTWKAGTRGLAPWHLQASSWCAGSPDWWDLPEDPQPLPFPADLSRQLLQILGQVHDQFHDKIWQIFLQVTCTIKVGDGKRQWALICPSGFPMIFVLLCLGFSFHLLAQLTYGLSMTTNTKYKGDDLLNQSLTQIV